jgi:hypothetical protein
MAACSRADLSNGLSMMIVMRVRTRPCATLRSFDPVTESPKLWVSRRANDKEGELQTHYRVPSSKVIDNIYKRQTPPIARNRKKYKAAGIARISRVGLCV